MVTRLLGFSVGLSALTAWGLARFNSLRGDIDLPPITDPGFESALRDASGGADREGHRRDVPRHRGGHRDRRRRRAGDAPTADAHRRTAEAADEATGRNRLRNARSNRQE